MPPWPYFLGSVLIAALLAGAVLWFVERQIASVLRNRLDRIEKQAATSNRRLDDLEQSQQSDGARLNELQQNHLPELYQALQLQKKRVEHLTELIDLSAQTQAEPTSEIIVWLKPPSVTGEPANEGDSDDKRVNGTEGEASADSAMSVEAKWVEVKVFAIGGQHNRVVVQRVIERPIERDDAGEIDPTADHDHASPPTEQEPGPVEKAAADGIVDPVWKRVEESWWVTPDYRGFADAAEWVRGVASGWHDLVLGKPANDVALGAGFPAAPADVLGVIAAKVGLPGDSLFKDARRVFQYTGFALGVVSGAAPLANACLSSLAHDLLAEAAAKAFRVAIGDVLTPEEVRPIPADQLGPDGARARQFHSDLVAAESRQKAHELAMRQGVAEAAEDKRPSVHLWRDSADAETHGHDEDEDRRRHQWYGDHQGTYDENCAAADEEVPPS